MPPADFFRKAREKIRQYFAQRIVGLVVMIKGVSERAGYCG